MAVRIKLGDYQTLSDDCLSCFLRMTEDEAWQTGRGRVEDELAL